MSSSTSEIDQHFECWGIEHPDSVMEITVIQRSNPAYAWITNGATHLYTIRADSWEDAMRAHHEIMGWKPYVPMEP